MHRRAALVGALLTVTMALPAVGQDAVDLDATTVGPNGEASTPVESIPALTDEEKASIAEGGHTAALLWAGAGTWYNALTAGAKDAFGELGIEVVTEAEAARGFDVLAVEGEGVGGEPGLVRFVGARVRHGLRYKRRLLSRYQKWGERKNELVGNWLCSSS